MMIDTYVRPWWKTIVIYLLVVAVITAICLLVSMSMGFVMEDGFVAYLTYNFENARWPEIPLWVTVGLGLGTIIGPIFAFILWPILGLNKYDREWRKLNLLPVYPKDEFNVMFYPHKTKESEEPKWVKPFRFNTTLTIIGSNSFPAGYGVRTYQVFETEKGYRYQMSQSEFNRLAPDMKDGKIEGVFEWNLDYRWPSIVKIGD